VSFPSPADREFRGVITAFQETAKGNYVFYLAGEGERRFFIPREKRDKLKEGDMVRFVAKPSQKVPEFYFPVQNVVEVLKPAVHSRELFNDLPEDLKDSYMKLPFYERGLLEGQYRSGATLEDLITIIKKKVSASLSSNDLKPAENATVPEPVFKTAAGETVEVKPPVVEPPKNVFNVESEIANLEIFLSKATRPELTDAINKEHAELGWKARRTAFDIWRIGRMLVAEKEKLPHGEWEEFCRQNHPEIAARTIRNYMKVAMEISNRQLIAVLDQLPTQTYRMLGIVKPPKSEKTSTVSTTSSSSEETRGKIETVFEKTSQPTFLPPPSPQADTWESKCPHCHRPILVNSALKTVEILAEEAVPTDWEALKQEVRERTAIRGANIALTTMESPVEVKNGEQV
jgi:hypothetical protein